MSLSFFTWKMGSQYLLCFVAKRIKEKTNTNQLAPNPQWVLNKFESISLAFTLKGHSNIKPLMTSDCSHEIKRRLLLGREAMTNLDRVLKSRDITLPTNVHMVKAMIFLVVKYGCESWVIMKVEHWRIDVFELWCSKKTLESPLDSKEIKPVNPKGN